MTCYLSIFIRIDVHKESPQSLLIHVFEPFVAHTTMTIQVAVGILFKDEHSVLLCQRPEHKNYPLKWEFPGGKVEAGETPEAALARELQEELGIQAKASSLLHSEKNSYDDGNSYQVEYYKVTQWNGNIENKEFAATEWVNRSVLTQYDILDGNRTICRKLADL